MPEYRLHRIHSETGATFAVFRAEGGKATRVAIFDKWIEATQYGNLMVLFAQRRAIAAELDETLGKILDVMDS